MLAFRWYLVISTVNGFAAAVIFTLNLVYQIRTVGLGPLHLVLVGTVMEVVCFVAQTPTGLIADRFGRKLSVCCGFALMGAGMLVEGLVPAFGPILVGIALWGIGACCVDGALEAWVADEIGDAVSDERTFTRGAQAAQVATVLGIGAAVPLAGIRLNVPILVGAVLWLLLAAALVAAMPEHAFRRPPADVGMFRQLGDGLRVIRRRPALVRLIAVGLFVGLGSEGFDRLEKAHFLTFAFPAGGALLWFGVLGATGLLGSVFLTGALARRVDAGDPGRLVLVLTVVQGLFVAAVAGFALSGVFWAAAVAYMAARMLRSAAGPFFALVFTRHTEPAHRATVLSVAGQVDAVGQIAGGPVVGFVGEVASVRLALLATALLMAPAVPLLSRVPSAGRVPADAS